MTCGTGAKMRIVACAEDTSFLASANARLQSRNVDVGALVSRALPLPAGPLGCASQSRASCSNLSAITYLSAACRSELRRRPAANARDVQRLPMRWALRENTRQVEGAHSECVCACLCLHACLLGSHQRTHAFMRNGCTFRTLVRRAGFDLEDCSGVCRVSSSYLARSAAS